MNRASSNRSAGGVAARRLPIALAVSLVLTSAVQARKLLIALWRMVTTGEVPDGVVLRPTA